VWIESTIEKGPQILWGVQELVDVHRFLFETEKLRIQSLKFLDGKGFKV
jgi:hypothetical protein